MRRLFVVVLVLAALGMPMRPDPAGAAAAAACTMNGIQAYGPPLPPAVNPPGNHAVAINMTLTCIGVSPATFGLSAAGAMFGSCAAETGTAGITTPGVTGTMTWARVGFHDYFAVNFAAGGTSYVWTGPVAWMPPGALDCVTPGVAVAGLTGFGPLAGA